MGPVQDAVSSLCVVYQFLSKTVPLRKSLGMHHIILFDCFQNKIFLTVPESSSFEIKGCYPFLYTTAEEQLKNSYGQW